MSEFLQSYIQIGVAIKLGSVTSIYQGLFDVNNSLVVNIRVVHVTSFDSQPANLVKILMSFGEALATSAFHQQGRSSIEFNGRHYTYVSRLRV